MRGSGANGRVDGILPAIRTCESGQSQKETVHGFYAQRLTQNDSHLRKSRGEKIDIYNWLDRGVVAEFSSRIEADLSLAIRQEIEQKCKVTTRKSA